MLLYVYNLKSINKIFYYLKSNLCNNNNNNIDGRDEIKML